jgi:hypothetical protein
MKNKPTTSEIIAQIRAADAAKPPCRRPPLPPEEQMRMDAWEQFDKTAAMMFERFENCEYLDLSQAERDCLNLWWLCAEFNSGGFHTFFFHDSGNYIRDTQDALKRIGATETHNILSQAIASFLPNEPPSPDPDTRFDQMNALPAEALETQAKAVDDAFSKCDEDIKRLYNEYWYANKGQPE